MAILEKPTREVGHTNSGIYQQNPTAKNYSCEYIFCEKNNKVGLFVCHLESFCVPLLVRVPQFGNHCLRGSGGCYTWEVGHRLHWSRPCVTCCAFAYVTELRKFMWRHSDLVMMSSWVVDRKSRFFWISGWFGEAIITWFDCCR